MAELFFFSSLWLKTPIVKICKVKKGFNPFERVSLSWKMEGHLNDDDSSAKRYRQIMLFVEMEANGQRFSSVRVRALE